MGWDTRERREYVRAKHAINVVLKRNDGSTFTTKTETISIMGLSALIEVELTVGEHVLIELHIGSNITIKCEAEIRWTLERKPKSPQEPSTHEIGVKFKGVSDPDVLREVVKTHYRPE